MPATLRTTFTSHCPRTSYRDLNGYKGLCYSDIHGLFNFPEDTQELDLILTSEPTRGSYKIVKTSGSASYALHYEGRWQGIVLYTPPEMILRKFLRENKLQTAYVYIEY